MPLLLLLASCTTLSPPSPANGTPSASKRGETFAKLTYQEKLTLNGRLSVRYQDNMDKKEVLHGSFAWTQDANRTNVQLQSPLGQTIAVINVTPEGATLQQNNQPMRNAPNVDQLFTETLGWPLPIEGLRNWLQGFAVDSNGNHVTATPQLSEIATQDGWRIRYANWQQLPHYSMQPRPKRLDLERNTLQAGNVSIRIVIDNWQ